MDPVRIQHSDSLVICFNNGQIPYLQDVKSKVDQSYQTADEFTKVYYDSVDKKRHVSGADSRLRRNSAN